MEHTPLDTFQLQALHADLHPSRVAKRDQGRQTLSYLEAYDVKAMLIRAFGYAGFSAECLDARILREAQTPQSQGEGTNWSVTAQATVRITIHQTGAVYTETAVATNAQPQYGEAADTAIKSAESDALKRAAIYLGTQFGLSLYNDGGTRDVVRRIFAPGQREITDDIVAARQPDGAAARDRLQKRLNVHPATPAEDPATRASANAQPEPVEGAPEPPPEPARAGPAKRPSKARQNAARAALEAAEARVGMGQEQS